MRFLFPISRVAFVLGMLIFSLNGYGALLPSGSWRVKVFAESMMTRSGRVIENAEIIGVQGTQVVIQHSEGVEIFQISDLPDEVRNSLLDSKGTVKNVGNHETEQLSKKIMDLTAENQSLREENYRLNLQLEKQGTRNQEKPEEKSLSSRGSTQTKGMVATPTSEKTNSSMLNYVVFEALEKEYAANFDKAQKKYKGNLFKVSGTISDFEMALNDRNTLTLTLKSKETEFRVFCKIHLEDLVKSYIKNVDRQKLDVRRAEKRIVLLSRPTVDASWTEDRTVMRMGEPLVFEGVCSGWAGTGVYFENCKKLTEYELRKLSTGR